MKYLVKIRDEFEIQEFEVRTEAETQAQITANETDRITDLYQDRGKPSFKHLATYVKEP